MTSNKTILKKGVSVSKVNLDSWNKSNKIISKKECRHKWRVGSFIGYFIGKQIRKKGINIWCERCHKKIKAYYKE
jgi:hypothetical protein